MTPAQQFNDLYKAIKRDMRWTDKQVASYLGIGKTSMWHKKQGRRVTKADLLSLAGLLAMKNRKHIDTFWEIADVK